MPIKEVQFSQKFSNEKSLCEYFLLEAFGIIAMFCLFALSNVCGNSFVWRLFVAVFWPGYAAGNPRI